MLLVKMLQTRLNPDYSLRNWSAMGSFWINIRYCFNIWPCVPRADMNDIIGASAPGVLEKDKKE
jgi:hypothetical protein